MNINHNSITSCLQLPSVISSLPRKSVLDFLEVSQPTLTRYQDYLNQIKPEGWDYIKGSRGFSRKSIFILCVLKDLIQTLGQAQAIMQLKPTLEEFYNDN